MSTSPTIIQVVSATEAALEDDVLVWLWERHESGRIRDLGALRSELGRAFPAADANVLERLFREFVALADFSAMADGVSESRAEVLPLVSFSHYQLVERDGQPVVRRGGLASIHKAIDTRFDRTIAIKVPLQRFARDPEVCARLEREAAICASLQHPNIVPVYEVGVYEAAGCPFFAMKYVEGRTLLHSMGARSPEFSQLRLLRAIREVCSALEHAHANGVVHRDVKPENVMIGEFGEVHLLDWGFARSMQAVEPGMTPRQRMMERFFMTETAGIFGTLAYMSPEQAQGRLEAISPKSDVFGVGGVLCHLLAGRPVYAGPPESLLRKAMGCETADALQALDATDAPPELKSLVRACLDPLPDMRPSIREVGQRIDAWLESLELARLRAEQRAHRMTMAFAASVVALITLVGGNLVYRQYKGAVIGETRDVSAVEAQAALLLDHAAKMQRQALRGETDDQQRQVDLALLDEAQRFAEEGLGIAQPISAMPEVAERGDKLLREIAAGRELVEFRIRDRRRMAEAGERDAQLLSRLGQALDLDEPLLLQCLCGVRLSVLPEQRSSAFQQAFVDSGINWTAQDAGQLAQALSQRPEAWRSELCGWLDLWACDASRLNDVALQKKIAAVQRDIEPSAAMVQLRQRLMHPQAIAADPQEWLADPEVRRSPASANLVCARLLQAGQIEPGLQLFRQTVFAHPRSVLANAAAGRFVLEHQHDERDAVVYLNAWRALTPERGLVLASLLVASGRDADATSLCADLRESGGLTPELEILEALCWSRLGNEQRGLACLKELARSKRETALVRLGVPIVLLQLGRVDEAEAAVEIRMADHPEERLLNLAKGRIQLRAGDAIGAESSFRTALDALPLDPVDRSAALAVLLDSSQQKTGRRERESVD